MSPYSVPAPAIAGVGVSEEELGGVHELLSPSPSWISDGRALQEPEADR